MAGLEDVLERLATDPAFKARLQADPAEALAGYTLSADDLTALARTVGAGSHDPVAQRTSKAGFFGLFAQIGDDTDAEKGAV